MEKEERPILGNVTDIGDILLRYMGLTCFHIRWTVASDGVKFETGRMNKRTNEEGDLRSKKQ